MARTGVVRLTPIVFKSEIGNITLFFFRDRTARPHLYNETLRSPLTCRRPGTGTERYRPERCNTATYFLSVTP